MYRLQTSFETPIIWETKEQQRKRQAADDGTWKPSSKLELSQRIVMYDPDGINVKARPYQKNAAIDFHKRVENVIETAAQNKLDVCRLYEVDKFIKFTLKHSYATSTIRPLGRLVSGQQELPMTLDGEEDVDKVYVTWRDYTMIREDGITAVTLRVYDAFIHELIPTYKLRVPSLHRK